MAKKVKNTEVAAATTDHFNLVATSKKVAISELALNPDNPRTKESDEEIQPLAMSIAEFGLLAPLVVLEPTLGQDKHVVLCGNRRLQALQYLGRYETQLTLNDHQLIRLYQMAENVPVICYASHPSIKQLAIVENSMRKALDPIREAEFVYATLLGGQETTQTERIEQLARSMSQTQDWIKACIRIATKLKAVPALEEVHQKAPMSFEVLAALTKLGNEELKEALEEIEEEGGAGNLRELKRLLNDYKHLRLKYAPWLLYADGGFDGWNTTVPKCAGCSFSTALQADLWGEIDPKEGRCTKRSCYDEKEGYWLESVDSLLWPVLHKTGQKHATPLSMTGEKETLSTRGLTLSDVYQDGFSVGVVVVNDLHQYRKGQVVFYKLREDLKQLQETEGSTAKTHISWEEENARRTWLREQVATPLMDRLVYSLINSRMNTAPYSKMVLVRQNIARACETMISALPLLYMIKGELKKDAPEVAKNAAFKKWCKEYDWDRKTLELWHMCQADAALMRHVQEVYLYNHIHMILSNVLEGQANTLRYGKNTLEDVCAVFGITPSVFLEKYLIPAREAVIAEALPSMPAGMDGVPENFMMPTKAANAENGEEVEDED